MACLRQSSRANAGFGLAENTYDLFVGKTLLHGDVLMWLMKTLLTSRCINQRGHELVGIVTPFSAQVSAIKSSLLKLDINCSGDENSLTVGTVHSLQGRNGQLCCSLLCFRTFNVVDDFNREALAIEINRNIPAQRIIRVLDRIVAIWTCLRIQARTGLAGTGTMGRRTWRAARNNANQFEYKERQDRIQANTDLYLSPVEEHDEAESTG
jgi:hypothetical protein